MIKRHLANSYFRSSVVAVAIAVLFGCGGGGDTDSALNETPASVQVNESATILSVRTELPSSSKKSEFEAQALHFTFAATIDSGPLGFAE